MSKIIIENAIEDVEIKVNASENIKWMPKIVTETRIEGLKIIVEGSEII